MEATKLLVDILLPATLLLIMFGMGMTLTLRDFLNLRHYPRAVVAGLVGQLLLLPAVGFALAGLWGLAPALAVGLIVLTACPGGTTSNLVSYLARGDGNHRLRPPAFFHFARRRRRGAVSRAQQRRQAFEAGPGRL